MFPSAPSPRRRPSRRCPTVAALSAALLAIVGAAVSIGALGVPAAGAANWAPVHPGDFPDPDILYVPATNTSSAMYYGFATQNFASASQTINIQVSTSTDGVTWNQLNGVTRCPRPFLGRGGDTWAPSVAYNGSEYLMYYTATVAANGDECIGEATSSTPLGPYSDTNPEPVECQVGLGGSIDPDIFTDSSTGDFVAHLEERRQPHRSEHRYLVDAARRGPVPPTNPGPPPNSSATTSLGRAASSRGPTCSTSREVDHTAAAARTTSSMPVVTRVPPPTASAGPTARTARAPPAPTSRRQDLCSDPARYVGAGGPRRLHAGAVGTAGHGLRRLAGRHHRVPFLRHPAHVPGRSGLRLEHGTAHTQPYPRPRGGRLPRRQPDLPGAPAWVLAGRRRRRGLHLWLRRLLRLDGVDEAQQARGGDGADP